MTASQEHAFCKYCKKEYTASKITNAFCNHECHDRYYSRLEADVFASQYGQDID